MQLAYGPRWVYSAAMETWLIWAFLVALHIRIVLADEKDLHLEGYIGLYVRSVRWLWGRVVR